MLVVIAFELLAQLCNSRPTAHPDRVEGVSAHFEGRKAFFDVVSVAMFDPTAQPCSGDGSPLAVGINEKTRVFDIALLGEIVKKFRCWIGDVAAEHGYIQ